MISTSEQKKTKERRATWLFPWNTITSILFTSALLIICLVTWLVFSKKNSFDQYIFECISTHITSFRIKLMIFISFFSNHYFLIPANLLLLLYFSLRKNKWASLTVLVIASGSVILLSVFKRIIHRERPIDRLVDGITNFSFPSGHAFMSVTFYGLIIWWVAVYIKNKKTQRIAICLLLLFILIIGFSRVYLKVHYASDVIAGWSVGVCWLLFSLNLMNKLRDKYNSSPL